MKIEITLAVSQEKVPLRHQKYQSGIVISKKLDVFQSLLVLTTMAFVTLNRGIFVHLFFSMCHQSCALKMRKISRNQEFYHQKKLYFTH